MNKLTNQKKENLIEKAIDKEMKILINKIKLGILTFYVCLLLAICIYGLYLCNVNGILLGIIIGIDILSIIWSILSVTVNYICLKKVEVDVNNKEIEIYKLTNCYNVKFQSSPYEVYIDKNEV